MINQEAVRFPVFVDDKGNRFIFPEVYSYKEKSVSWTYCRSVCVALNVTEEKDTFDVIPEDGYLNFSRIVAAASSSGFYHGGTDLWLIVGPVYQEGIDKLPVSV